MTTATKKRPGEFDWIPDEGFTDEEILRPDARNEPMLYPLYSGIACRKCHCPMLIDLGLENKSSKPKAIKRMRHWYSCPICQSGTIRPDVVGKLTQIGEIDTWSFRLRKSGDKDADQNT